jgi:hypothetical protein
VTAPVRVLLLAAIGLIALAGAGAIGWAIGNSTRSDQAVHTGVVVETRAEGTATAGGVTYVLPVNVSWIDAAGTIHDGPGPPPCLRRGRARRVEFATVNYSVAGDTQGIVVWVRC